MSVVFAQYGQNFQDIFSWIHGSHSIQLGGEFRRDPTQNINTSNYIPRYDFADILNFDPMAFAGVNFPLIKNLYDSLIEYTPEGRAIPSLASSWTIAPSVPCEPTYSLPMS